METWQRAVTIATRIDHTRNSGISIFYQPGRNLSGWERTSGQRWTAEIEALSLRYVVPGIPESGLPNLQPWDTTLEQYTEARNYYHSQPQKKVSLWLFAPGTGWQPLFELPLYNIKPYRILNLKPYLTNTHSNFLLGENCKLGVSIEYSRWGRLAEGDELIFYGCATERPINSEVAEAKAALAMLDSRLVQMGGGGGGGASAANQIDFRSDLFPPNVDNVFEGLESLYNNIFMGLEGVDAELDVLRSADSGLSQRIATLEDVGVGGGGVVSLLAKLMPYGNGDNIFNNALERKSYATGSKVLEFIRWQPGRKVQLHINSTAIANQLQPDRPHINIYAWKVNPYAAALGLWMSRTVTQLFSSQFLAVYGAVFRYKPEASRLRVAVAKVPKEGGSFWVDPAEHKWISVFPYNTSGRIGYGGVYYGGDAAMFSWDNATKTIRLESF